MSNHSVSLFEKTKQELHSDRPLLSGRISIGGTPLKRLLQAATALRVEHPNVCFDFYTSDATDVIERLDHGILDFAVLLEPVDAVKYEYLSLKDSARWGLFMPSDCTLAGKAAVTKEELRAFRSSCTAVSVCNARLRTGRRPSWNK